MRLRRLRYLRRAPSVRPHLLAALLTTIASLALVAPTAHAQASNLDVLFLGDRGHHQPRARFDQLEPVFAKRGIRLVYTEELGQLNLENLRNYDALLLYANIDNIEPPQAQALLDYVDGGGGFVPLHCATYCFRNDDRIVALMGGQFQRHGTGVFRTSIAAPNHPLMRGFGGFESWDETYVHHLHNEKNRTVLTYRVDGEGREPWTWIRTQGQGRVFYTAWGHDHRTWGNPGFQNLIERGVRWAAGGDPAAVPNYLADRPFPTPEMTPPRTDLAPLEYVEVGAKIPNYTPGERWGTQGELISKMQKPLAADESLKHMQTPVGFRVELFASEPDIGGKPITMAWDERGRLWIAETYDYPNELQPTGKGRDRIRILEDTDGDWRADKFTVFAEQLSIPTAIAFSQGGVIVQDSTRTLFLRDTDGDDVADERQVLFTGWNQGDTHGGVSNFQYGLDNWIWAMQGYNNSAPVVAGKQMLPFRQGFFRFRPDGAELEFIRSTNNNTWGLGISEEGLIFGSTANHNPSVYMPIPNRYYERVRGWTASLQLGTIADTHLFKPVTKHVRQVDQHGGYTAGAGHALYTARQYPQEYWNRTAFVNGPTGHLVGTFVLKPDGSDFHSTSPFNLLASTDEWTAPIMSEVGPDGNVWVLDWYNYIVQHNPTPRGFEQGKGNAYVTDLRDKRHGRIVRVAYGDAAKPFTLAGASPQKLVETLSHPTMLWRKHAQRLLVEQRAVDTADALIALVGDTSMDEVGLNVGAIHALWTLHGLGLLDGSHPAATSAAVAALRHPSAGVRHNAAQVLPPSSESVNALLSAELLSDPIGTNRLAALLALADMPAHPEAGKAILRTLADPNIDRWIKDAAISAAATQAGPFLAAVGTASKPSEDLLEVTNIIATHFGRLGPVDSVASVIHELTTADPQISATVLAGLTAWPEDKRPTIDARLESDLKQLMSKLPISARGSLVKLAQRWGGNQFDDYAKLVSESLLKQLDDDSVSLRDRLRAARELVSFQANDGDLVEELLDRVTPQAAPEYSAGLIEALRGSQAKDLGKQLIEKIGAMTPRSREAALELMLAKTSTAATLLDAIDGGEVQISELALNQRESLLAHPEEKLRARARAMLSRGGALPNADRQAVLKTLLPLTEQKGDVKAGKAVFAKNCGICHMHSGEGKRIGPDLTGMAVHPKAELLGHIIDPSKDVEGNYRVFTVQTEDGEVINGLLASESRTAIEMFDAKGNKQVLLREDVARIKASTKSLMPEGFEKQVSQEEIVHLLEFLTARGKYTPIDLRKVATIPSDRGMFFGADSQVERLIFPDWSPKTFKGVPFQLIDPSGGKVKNTIMLYGPQGNAPRQMPRSVTLPCHGPARAVHLLSGVSGWGHPLGEANSVSMIVRLHYADGQTEDHELLNGVHFADYIRRVDVPKSEHAFQLRGQQIRYLAVHPQRPDSIETIELVKGPDNTVPIVMAVTLENAE